MHDHRQQYSQTVVVLTVGEDEGTPCVQVDEEKESDIETVELSTNDLCTAPGSIIQRAYRAARGNATPM